MPPVMTGTPTVGDIGQFYDVSKVLVGSAVGFIAPVGTADPPDSATVFDPTVWTTPWTSCGGTEQGWQVNWAPQTQDISIDEQPTPVDQQMTTASLQFTANLSQDTVASWGYALNADSTITAAAVGVMGKTTLTPNPVLKRYKVVLETHTTGNFARRYIVPIMTCAANVGAQFRRAAGQRIIPVTFTSICALNQIKMIEYTAVATG